MRNTLIALSMLASACGNKDPFDNNATDAPIGDGGPNDGGTADAPPPRACAAPPARIVVLGDSITACSVVGGPQNANCMAKQFSDYTTTNYGPGAAYQNFAVGGAKLSGIAAQLTSIPAQAGPALVMIYIGGNDLSPFIFQSDAQAMAGYEAIKTQMDSVYANVFTTLADTTKFPGGATLLMNTQYNPFDDCTAAPYNLSQVKTGILHMYNDKLRTIAAAQGDAAIIVDQHGPYLGHGHHVDVSTCPHFNADATPFMQDTIHANAAGNVGLAGVANVGADRLYRDCIP